MGTRKPDSTPAGSTKERSALDGLLEILDLERLEVNLFRGRSPDVGWQRVYGGQVIGQALVAAVRTVDNDRTAHSLHGYFMRPGDPSVPIVYDVERIRDGRSFLTRRVVALQHGQAIFSMSVSFHKVEEGFDHQIDLPRDIPQPEDLPSEKALIENFRDKMPDNIRAYWERERPIELRPTDISRYFSKDANEPQQYVWIRANGALPQGLSLHECVLAYASDFTLLDTALVAHGRVIFDPDLQLASLDHAIWFHRPVKADEWLLYAQDSPSAFGARGFCRGSVYTREGVLVASVAQEGLIRVKRAESS